MSGERSGFMTAGGIIRVELSDVQRRLLTDAGIHNELVTLGARQMHLYGGRPTESEVIPYCTICGKGMKFGDDLYAQQCFDFKVDDKAGVAEFIATDKVVVHHKPCSELQRRREER